MSCRVCGQAEVSVALDLGAHPVSSHYARAADAAERTFPLELGQCPRCQVIQLVKAAPYKALIPPYDWIWAREPEDHLDTVVAKLAELPGLDRGSTIVGLTSKDDTTLARFARLGFERTWRVDPREDLGVTDPAANIETVQSLTTPERMAALAATKGLADLLIVRHIVEHAEDPRSFVAGCAALVREGGYVAFEAPDCARSLALNDYAMPWEEHTLYLNQETIGILPPLGGLSALALDNYPYPFENSLVLLCRKGGVDGDLRLSAPSNLIDRYAAAFGPVTRALRDALTAAKETGPIALFGAGHLACAFVNFHGLADLIDFVADDTPQKQGLFLPGARLPILPSAALVERGVKLCLLAISPGSEAGVIARQSQFADSGGEFRSVLAASERSLPRPGASPGRLTASA